MFFKRPSEKILCFLFFDLDVIVALKPDTILSMLPLYRLGILFILNQKITMPLCKPVILCESVIQS